MAMGFDLLISRGVGPLYPSVEEQTMKEGKPVQSGVGRSGIEGRHTHTHTHTHNDGVSTPSALTALAVAPSLRPGDGRGLDSFSPLAKWGRLLMNQARTRKVVLLENYTVLSSWSTAKPAGPRPLGSSPHPWEGGSFGVLVTYTNCLSFTS